MFSTSQADEKFSPTINRGMTCGCGYIWEPVMFSMPESVLKEATSSVSINRKKYYFKILLFFKLIE